MGILDFGLSHITRATDRNFNSAEALKQREWAEEMSSTAHQREVTDLQEAGLNPALSAMGGNGSATPGGASASTGGGVGKIGILDGLNAAATLALTGKKINNLKLVNSAMRLVNHSMRRL